MNNGGTDARFVVSEAAKECFGPLTFGDSDLQTLQAAIRIHMILLRQATAEQERAGGLEKAVAQLTHNIASMRDLTRRLGRLGELIASVKTGDDDEKED